MLLSSGGSFRKSTVQTLWEPYLERLTVEWYMCWDFCPNKFLQWADAIPICFCLLVVRLKIWEQDKLWEGTLFKRNTWNRIPMCLVPSPPAFQKTQIRYRYTCILEGRLVKSRVKGQQMEKNGCFNRIYVLLFPGGSSRKLRLRESHACSERNDRVHMCLALSPRNFRVTRRQPHVLLSYRGLLKQWS